MNYALDEVQKFWEVGKRATFDEMVETFNMSGSVSLVASPDGSPNVAKQNSNDDLQKPQWVSKGIERLNGNMTDLKHRNCNKQELVVMYNKERLELTKQPTDGPQQQQLHDLTTGQKFDEQPKEDLLYITNDPWPTGGGRDSANKDVPTEELQIDTQDVRNAGGNGISLILTVLVV